MDCRRHNQSIWFYRYEAKQLQYDIEWRDVNNNHSIDTRVCIYTYIYLASFTRIGRIDSVLVDAGALRVGTLHQQIALFAAVGAQRRGRAALGAQTAVAEADRFVGLALALCAVFARDRFDDLREEVGDGGAVDTGDVEHAHVVRDVGAQHTCLQRVFGARVAFESAQRLLRIKVAKVGVLRRQLRVAKLRH